MKVFDRPRRCSSCGEFDNKAVLGATTVIKRGKPLFPSRALIYCQRCMISKGDRLVVLKSLMDLSRDDLREYIRKGYLNLGVLGVTLGEETQKRLTDELDRQILIKAANNLGKSEEEIMFLTTKEFSYYDLYEIFYRDIDKVVRTAVPKTGSK